MMPATTKPKTDISLLGSGEGVGVGWGENYVAMKTIEFSVWVATKIFETGLFDPILILLRGDLVG
jgi:hypothetical protein